MSFYDDLDAFEHRELPEILPAVVFKTRVRDESVGGPNPYRWQDVNSYDYFGGKRVVI